MRSLKNFGDGGASGPTGGTSWKPNGNASGKRRNIARQPVPGIGLSVSATILSAAESGAKRAERADTEGRNRSPAGALNGFWPTCNAAGQPNSPPSHGQPGAQNPSVGAGCAGYIVEGTVSVDATGCALAMRLARRSPAAAHRHPGR